MGLLINCPLGAAISDIDTTICPESSGQIQKSILQRIYASAGVKNKIVVATSDPKLLATWTALLSAADGTKVVQTPYIHAPVTEAGAARTFGGGNETVGGIEIIIGREPTSFTGNFIQVSQKAIAQLKTYQGENVGVYLNDEYGRIIALADDVETPTEIYPIPISAFFVGDKTLGGLEDVDKNMVSWKFNSNWSDKLVIITPTDFNSLTDLVTP